jgi:hypothetical protein
MDSVSFLVSSFRKKGKSIQDFFQALPRILMSIFIALVISKPLELQLFQSEIDFKLIEIRGEKLMQIEKSFNEKILHLEHQENEYQKSLQSSFKLKEFYYAQYKCECDGTCGTRNSGRGSECLRKQKKYEAYTKEHEEIQQKINHNLTLLSNEKVKLNIEKDKEKEVLRKYFSKGLLARLEALSLLSGNTSMAILLLFIFLETAPILSKLFAPIGPYDHLLQSKEFPYKIAYMGQIQEHQLPTGLKSIPENSEINSFRKESENRSHEKMIKDDAAIQLAQLQEKLVNEKK